MFLLLLFGFFWGVSLSEPLMRNCEPIRVEMCMMWYNSTSMPNLGGNDIQQEADLQLQSFSPLIQYGCSQNLKLFLCSVYVPMCTEKVTNPIGPCRGLCEGVRSRCYPVLQGFGFPWPDALNCSRFPEINNHEHMCIEGPKDEIDIRAPVDPAVQKFDCELRKNGEGCQPGCNSNNMFEESEKKFAEVWVTVWGFICLIISLGAAMTLTIGGGRVKARPLLSLALCYVLLSTGWALRMFSGRITMSCPKSPEDGLSNINCAFIFLLLYYFGMAANAWWVCLCAWWVARVGLSWPPEKMRSLSSVLHVCAWSLPAAQTVAALVRRDVDSDDLTGTCYIGNRNSTTLLSLVLIPYFFYFTTGTVLLFLGCSYVMRKPRSLAAAPLTNAAPRKESDFLGAICTLYAIPTFCVMASIYYEYNNRDRWLAGERKPALWAFLLKYFMSLFIGVSSVFWIWSMKSVMAWRSILRRLGPRKQLPLKVQTMPQVMRYMPAQTLSTSLSTTSKHSTRTHPHRKPRVHHHMRSGSETVI
ncbi:frizzled-4-like [Diabrotica virgifera virgifera]|uniref:Frizzled-4 n=1 Tax=Diabrotica virgifera virgifera TaxID=50390 RepID=A0ABM5IP25_DIAVI|nr:frizzled-4-like [Diabrotica virgifera virgifera]